MAFEALRTHFDSGVANEIRRNVFQLPFGKVHGAQLDTAQVIGSVAAKVLATGAVLDTNSINMLQPVAGSLQASGIPEGTMFMILGSVGFTTPDATAREYQVSLAIDGTEDVGTRESETFSSANGRNMLQVKGFYPAFTDAVDIYIACLDAPPAVQIKSYNLIMWALG